MLAYSHVPCAYLVFIPSAKRQKVQEVLTNLRFLSEVFHESKTLMTVLTNLLLCLARKMRSTHILVYVYVYTHISICRYIYIYEQ
jgi:F0F1-type ATP synthase delta subunit